VWVPPRVPSTASPPPPPPAAAASAPAPQQPPPPPPAAAASAPAPQQLLALPRRRVEARCRGRREEGRGSGEGACARAAPMDSVGAARSRSPRSTRAHGDDVMLQLV
jgi:hypothetical protein